MPSYTIQELNGIPYLVIKEDGINISRIKFPHDMEIGLNNSNYNSNLLVKGTISGSIHNTKDGLSYLVAGSGISITSGSNGQVTIGSSGGTGDITSVVAGVGLSGGGTEGDITLTLDLSELSSVTPASGDSLATLDSNGSTEQRTTVDNLATLFAGDGLTAASAVMAIGAGTGIDVAANAISVDVSDFMTNGLNNRIVTATGTDAMNAEANLTFDGSTLNAVGDIQMSGDLLLNTTNPDPTLIKNNTYLKLQSTGSIWIQVDDGGTKTSSFRIYSGSQAIMNVSSNDFSTTFSAGDVFITNNNDLRLNVGSTLVLDNDSDSEVYLSSSGGASLDVDGHGLLNLYADNNIIHYLGNHQAGTHSRNSFNGGNNTFNVDRNDMDFRIHTDNHYATFFVDAGDDTVIIGGQNFNATPTASQLVSKGYGNDVKVLLSGTYDSKDGTDRGVILMAGDTAVSGNLHIVGDSSSKRKIISSGSMTVRSINGTTSVVGDDNVSVWIGYDGKGSDQSFSIYKGSGGYEQIFVVNEDKSVRIFGELDVESSLVVHLDYDSDNSNSYFGTKNGGGTFNQVFYEDGRAFFNYGRQSTGDFIVNGDTKYGLIFVDAGADAVALGSSTDSSPAWSEFKDTGTDVKVLLSGTIGSIGGVSRGITLNAGDLVVSGSTKLIGDLTLSNNVIKASDGGSTITMDTSDNVTIAGNLTVSGGDILGPTDDTLFIKSDHNINVILDNDNDSTRYFLVGNHAGTYKYVISEEGKINQGDSTVPKNSYTLRHTNADGDNGLLLVNNNAAVASGDFLGGVGFDSADGNVPSSILEASAYIGAFAAEDHGNSDKGGHLVFGNAPINQNDDTTSTENMRISSAGNVTAPNNCFVSVTKTSTTTNITKDTAVDVVFDNEVEDNQSTYDNSTGIFTAPVDGYYHFEIFVRVLQVDTSTDDTVQLRLETGGDSNNYVVLTTDGFDRDVDVFPLQMSTIVKMDVSDTAVAQVYYHASNSQLDIYGSATVGFTSKMQIRLVQ